MLIGVLRIRFICFAVYTHIVYMLASKFRVSFIKWLKKQCRVIEMVYDLIVIGSGIVGLASSYQFLKKKPNARVLILEKEEAEARHQTGHNSGVLHSGIYYEPGSLKAKNCQKGYKQMLDYCRTKEIDHEICGKVILAIKEDERAGLHKIFERGQKNALKGVKLLSAEEVQEIEPHARCVEGLWVPQAGIVDYKQVAKSLLNDVQELGAVVRFGCHVLKVQSSINQEIVVKTEQGDFFSKLALNCAGVYADRFVSEEKTPLDIRIIPFRGEYYNLKPAKKKLVKNLIYPVPDLRLPFLGVHFTRRVDGMVEVGPNAVFAFHREGYSFFRWSTRDVLDSLSWPGFRKFSRKYWRYGCSEMYRSLSKKAFLKSMRAIIPDIQAEDITVGDRGVRAQACYRDGRLCDDFVIIRESKMGGNYINVCNAPSPAATSSLSIGEHITNLLLQ